MRNSVSTSISSRVFFPLSRRFDAFFAMVNFSSNIKDALVTDIGVKMALGYNPRSRGNEHDLPFNHRSPTGNESVSSGGTA